MGDIRSLFQGDKLVGEALGMGEGLEQAARGNQDKHVVRVCTEGSNWFRWSQRGPTKRTDSLWNECAVRPGAKEEWSEAGRKDIPEPGNDIK